MKLSKRVATSLRLDPEVKADAEKLAKIQNRSMSNLIEILLIEACRKHGVNGRGPRK